jgi:N-acetylglucosaminyldiphosphoundecaprenol N-acetyl-beta-D-mannosaminyltransferase
LVCVRMTKIPLWTVNCNMPHATERPQTTETPMSSHDALAWRERTSVWGLPLAPLTASEALDALAHRIESGIPSFIITANLNYAMLAAKDEALRELNDRAFLILADGMPLVWASRWTARPIPERVAGSDLIFDTCAMAAERGYRVFLLGGGPGGADTAAANLLARNPKLQIVGTECPPFRPLSRDEHEALLARIRDARPHLLLVAFGQPKGENWIAQNLEALRVPVMMQVGASLDFAAGKIRRAPRWLQRAGMEWAFRFYLEPRRLGGRYLANAVFLQRCVARDLARAVTNHLRRLRVASPPPVSRGGTLPDH